MFSSKRFLGNLTPTLCKPILCHNVKLGIRVQFPVTTPTKQRKYVYINLSWPVLKTETYSSILISIIPCQLLKKNYICIYKCTAVEHFLLLSSPSKNVAWERWPRLAAWYMLWKNYFDILNVIEGEGNLFNGHLKTFS